MRKVVFRVDAGGSVGFGHAIRCVGIARCLSDRFGLECVFYSRSHPDLIELYRTGSIPFVTHDTGSELDVLRRIAVETPGAVLFIDRLFPYGSGIIRELARGMKVVMFHNVCEGMFEADYAIFPIAHLADEVISDPRWARSPARLVHGTKYVIISPEVERWARQDRTRTPGPYLAIASGASDPRGVLVRIVEWLNEERFPGEVEALYGFDFCHHDALNALRPQLIESIRLIPFDHPRLFGARLAISAFGVTTYELIYAGTPVATIGLNEANSAGAERLENRHGCVRHLGRLDELDRSETLSTVLDLWRDEGALQQMRGRQQGLIDGNGTDRIAAIIHEAARASR